MNKKKLKIPVSTGAKREGLVIGICICAVIILIFSALTTVVGYQFVKSTTPAQSPLFSIRTQKAVNKGSNILTSNYLGQGLQTISFPLKDNRSALIPKIIDRIQTMNDEEFSRFQNIILSWFYEKQHISNTPIIHQLQLIRQQYIPTELDITLYDIIKNETRPPTYSEFTCKIACGIFLLFSLLLVLLLTPFYLIAHLSTLYQCQYGYIQ